MGKTKTVKSSPAPSAGTPNNEETEMTSFSTGNKFLLDKTNSKKPTKENIIIINNITNNKDNFKNMKINSNIIKEAASVNQANSATAKMLEAKVGKKTSTASLDEDKSREEIAVSDKTLKMFDDPEKENQEDHLPWHKVVNKKKKSSANKLMKPDHGEPRKEKEMSPLISDLETNRKPPTKIELHPDQAPIAPKLVFNVKPDEIPRMMTCLYPGVCSEVLLALHASMNYNLESTIDELQKKYGSFAADSELSFTQPAAAPSAPSFAEVAALPALSRSQLEVPKRIPLIFPKGRYITPTRDMAIHNGCSPEEYDRIHSEAQKLFKKWEDKQGAKIDKSCVDRKLRYHYNEEIRRAAEARKAVEKDMMENFDILHRYLSNNFMDAHLLTVDLSKEATTTRLKLLNENNCPASKLYIVTGAGNGSVGNIPVIRKQLLKKLKGEGYYATLFNDGCIEVDRESRKPTGRNSGRG